MDKTREAQIAMENRLREACKREKKNAGVLKALFFRMSLRKLSYNAEEMKAEAEAKKQVMRKRKLLLASKTWQVTAARMKAKAAEAEARKQMMRKRKLLIASKTWKATAARMKAKAAEAEARKQMMEARKQMMQNRKLLLAFNTWQETVAQTPFQDALVHEEDATAEPMTCTGVVVQNDDDCLQTSGGTPPVSGTPRRWPWLLLFSCIGLVCCVVLMVMLMPVMSEDAHVEKPKNFQDIERASPQDIEEAMNQLKEETRAAEAIKDQKARKKARILKEDNERAAKLGPILQKQKQEYAKKKRAVDAEKKLLERHAKTTEEVDANVEHYFREVHNKAAKAKESKIKLAKKTAKTAVLDVNELHAKNAAKEAKAKKDARERVAKKKLAKKTAKTAVLDVNELQAKTAAKAAKVEKDAKEKKFKIAADERRQKTQKLLTDGYECCDLPKHATAEERAATKEALQKKQEKKEEKANLALQKTFCWGVSLPLAAAYPPLGVPAVATCAKFAYSN